MITILGSTVAACVAYGRRTASNELDALRAACAQVRKLAQRSPHSEQVDMYIGDAEALLVRAETDLAKGDRKSAMQNVERAFIALRQARQIVQPDEPDVEN